MASASNARLPSPSPPPPARSEKIVTVLEQTEAFVQSLQEDYVAGRAMPNSTTRAAHWYRWAVRRIDEFNAAYGADTLTTDWFTTTGYCECVDTPDEVPNTYRIAEAMECAPGFHLCIHASPSIEITLIVEMSATLVVKGMLLQADAVYAEATWDPSVAFSWTDISPYDYDRVDVCKDRALFPRTPLSATDPLIVAAIEDLDLFHEVFGDGLKTEFPKASLVDDILAQHKAKK